MEAIVRDKKKPSIDVFAYKFKISIQENQLKNNCWYYLFGEIKGW